MNDKLNLHFQKLNWILQASGENLDDIYNDRQKMQSYENIIILINNLWETNVVYWLAENYIIRILKNLEKVVWKEFDYPELETTAMLWHFVYWTEAFNNHIDAYRIILLQIYSEFIRFYKKGNLEHESIYLVILELKDMIDWLLEKKWSLNKVYDLLKNQKLKEWLLTINKGKSWNLVTYALPLDDELSWTPFRDTFFRYINQRHLKRKGPWVKK